MYHSIKKLKKDLDPSKYRLWYNNWVKENAKGKVLDVGKSKYWDYSFATIDINKGLKPTYVGNIEKTAFPSDMFDTVLCNGMYECVKNPDAMINEVFRIIKPGGIIIFGFVGVDYKPYKKNWQYWDKTKKLPGIEKDFKKEYHFIICKK